jgi:hypothetical protein
MFSLSAYCSMQIVIEPPPKLILQNIRTAVQQKSGPPLGPAWIGYELNTGGHRYIGTNPNSPLVWTSEGRNNYQKPEKMVKTSGF